MQRTIRTIVEEQDIVTASAQTSVSDAARMMKARGVGAMLVLGIYPALALNIINVGVQGLLR